MVQTTPAADKSQWLPTVASLSCQQSLGGEAETSMGNPVGEQGYQETRSVPAKNMVLI